MAAFLFAWNPNKWGWENLDEFIEKICNSGYVTERWSCASFRSVKRGDRAFLIRLGVEPKGIIGSGVINSDAYVTAHWDGSNKLEHAVNIDWDILINPDTEPILSSEFLNSGAMRNQNWFPQSSGISIRNELLGELEETWFEFLSSNMINSFQANFNAAYSEGRMQMSFSTSYERNPVARKICLEHYGYDCQVCGINFENQYGEIGKKFIHIHHLNPIGSSGIQKVDPKKDLIPVCPNCHAMLHQQTPPYNIEDMKRMVKVGDL